MGLSTKPPTTYPGARPIQFRRPDRGVGLFPGSEDSEGEESSTFGMDTPGTKSLRPFTEEREERV